MIMMDFLVFNLEANIKFFYLQHYLKSYTYPLYCYYQLNFPPKMTVNSKALDQQVANIKKIFTEGNQQQAIAACQSLVFFTSLQFGIKKITGKPISYVR